MSIWSCRSHNQKNVFFTIHKAYYRKVAAKNPIWSKIVRYDDSWFPYSGVETMHIYRRGSQGESTPNVGVKGTCRRLLCSILPLNWQYELRVVCSGNEWGYSKNLEATCYTFLPRSLFHEPQNQQHFQPKCDGEETSFEVAFQAFEGKNGHGHPQHLSASLQPSPGPITNAGQNQLVWLSSQKNQATIFNTKQNAKITYNCLPDELTVCRFWIHKHMLGMKNRYYVGIYVGKLLSTTVSTFGSEKKWIFQQFQPISCHRKLSKT